MAWRRLDVPRIVATALLGLMMPYLASCGGSDDGPPPTAAPGPDPAPDPNPPPDPTSQNRPPLAADDSVSTPRDMAVVIEVLANDTDPDGDELALGPVGSAAHGAATAQADGSIHYVPSSGFEGSDTFSYTVSDGLGGTDTAQVMITVLARVIRDALLERIAAAPEGSWLKVNTNRFDAVWTPTEQRAQVNGEPFGAPRKIVLAWGSMAWDPNRRQLIIWGGGHANYAGNDV
jgi:hypothetical protein